MLLIPCITTILFFIGVSYYNLMFGIIFFAVGLLLSVLIGTVMLKNPFSNMIEGKGLLVFNLDSTGLFQPFNVGLDNPYLKGKYNKQEIKDIFDRSAVMQIAPPQKARRIKQEENGNIIIELDTKKFNDARMAMYHFPVLIWNDQLKTFLTKSDLTDKEKTAYAEHGILYLNKQVEDLNDHLLNFGRYIVENIKPKKGLFANKWAIVIIIIVIVIIIIIASPILINTISGMSGSAVDAVSGAAGAITPK